MTLTHDPHRVAIMIAGTSPLPSCVRRPARSPAWFAAGTGVLLALLLTVVAPRPAWASLSVYDGFRLPPSNREADGPVAVQPDGKILVSGAFNSIGGAQRSNLARLHVDGTLDAGFNYDWYPGYSQLRHLDVLPDGRIVLTGGDQSLGRFAHLLNANGSTVYRVDDIDGNAVQAAVMQPDGKLLIAGEFTHVLGGDRVHIARLNPNGTLDTGFDPGLGADGIVTSLALQSDGKLLIAGDFNHVAGHVRTRVARLNPDGSLDSDFNPGAGANAIVRAIALQLDGQLVVGGDFTAAGHSTRRYIARLRQDGSLDTGFSAPGAGPNGPVHSVRLAPDGKVLIAGAFLSVNGQPRARVARLYRDGSLDPAYSMHGSAEAHDAPVPRRSLTGPNAPVDSIALQPDGRLLISGRFTEVDNELHWGVARLNADGTLDADLTFPQIVNLDLPGISAVVTQADGKIVLAGSFNTAHGVPRGGIARLHIDGTLDQGFDPGSGVGTTGTFASLGGVIVQADGRLLIHGGSTSFQSFNGVPRRGIARLEDNGALDLSFDPASALRDDAGVTRAALQSDGKVLVAGSGLTDENDVLVRFHADGSRDLSYDSRAGLDSRCFDGTWCSCQVESIGMQADDRHFAVLGVLEACGVGPFWRRVDRLNLDGSLDTGFSLGPTSSGPNMSPAMANPGFFPQPNGTSIIVGPDALDGQPIPGMARLNQDGSIDPTFVLDPQFDYGGRISLQADGRMVVTGGSGSLTLLARIGPDGAHEHGYAFAPPRRLGSGQISGATIQADGKPLLVGRFNYSEGAASICCEWTARLAASEAVVAHLEFDRDQARIDWRRTGPGPEFLRTTFDVSLDDEHWHPLGAGGLMSSAGFHPGSGRPASIDRSWLGWSRSDVHLPRERNVWVRAHGHTIEGSLHESVRLFHLDGGYTATPVAGAGGRVEPPFPQGGETGAALGFEIVPEPGYGIAEVSGCSGSLHGSTYLIAPLSADCQVTAVFVADPVADRFFASGFEP